MVVVGSALATAPGAGATPSHPGNVVETCPEVLAGAPTGGLEKATNPPAGSDVGRGAVIDVTLRWNTALFAGPRLHKALDCVTIDGHGADDLSVQQRDAANDGEFTTRIAVPGGLADGVRFCDRGFVSGPAGSGDFVREKSNDVCFTVRGDVPRAAVPVRMVTPDQAPGTSTSAPVDATPPPLPVAASPATTPPAPPVAPTSPGTAATATRPNQADLGADRAGHGPAGADVAGGAVEATQPVSTLPRTGSDLAPSILAGLGALVCGQLARLAAGRRPA
jgi:hypothetical protein